MINDMEDLITDYLSDTLDPAARRDFEQRIASDPELAARIGLERALIESLGDSPENRLRTSLRNISEKYDTPESLNIAAFNSPEKGRRFWWMLPVVLLLGGVVAWWMLTYRVDPVVPSELPVPEQERSPAPADIPVETPPAIEAPKQKRLQDNTRPIAAAFDPIPALETYIGSQLRGATFRLRIASPRSNETLPKRGEKTAFRLSGTVEGTIPAGQTFQVILLSNNIHDFEAMRPVERHLLALASDQTFIFEKQLLLPAGLYYMLIEEGQSGEWLLVDKFLVK